MRALIFFAEWWFHLLVGLSAVKRWITFTLHFLLPEGPRLQPTQENPDWQVTVLPQCMPPPGRICPQGSSGPWQRSCYRRRTNLLCQGKAGHPSSTHPPGNGQHLGAFWHRFASLHGGTPETCKFPCSLEKMHVHATVCWITLELTYDRHVPNGIGRSIATVPSWSQASYTILQWVQRHSINVTRRPMTVPNIFPTPSMWLGLQPWDSPYIPRSWSPNSSIQDKARTLLVVPRSFHHQQEKGDCIQATSLRHDCTKDSAYQM